MFSRAYRAAITLPPLLWVVVFLLIPYALLFCFSFWTVSPAQSIVHSGIREIICVPMKGRHETLGVLYLDTRTLTRDPLASLALPGKRSGKFSGDHLALASAIAHQAALAVEETRYHEAMVQAERLAAIGQTVAALSHHIKNILQGLRSGGEILKMGLTDKDETLLHQGWKIVEKNQGKVYDLGAYGNGSKMKFLANLLVAIHNIATAEAMVLGIKAGLDPSGIMNPGGLRP